MALIFIDFAKVNGLGQCALLNICEYEGYPKVNWKMSMSAVSNMKYNCAVVFLRQIYCLFMPDLVSFYFDLHK